MEPQKKLDRAEAKKIVDKLLTHKTFMRDYKIAFKKDFGYDIHEEIAKKRLVKLYRERIENRLERRV